MPKASFGPFADAFEKHGLTVPGYLELLHCRGSGVDLVLDRVQTALSAEKPQMWLDALFADPNWRPHLVGAAALLLDEARELNCSTMWGAIDGGSWVTPQLIATAYFVDREFIEHVIERLEKRCAISAPVGLSPLQRHSATGPAGAVQRSAKLLSALISIGRRAPPLASQLERVSNDAELARLLEEDRDRSGLIATSWCDQISAVFTARNRTLEPRFG